MAIAALIAYSLAAVVAGVISIKKGWLMNNVVNQKIEFLKEACNQLHREAVQIIKYQELYNISSNWQWADENLKKHYDAINLILHSLLLSQLSTLCRILDKDEVRCKNIYRTVSLHNVLRTLEEKEVLDKVILMGRMNHFSDSSIQEIIQNCRKAIACVKDDELKKFRNKCMSHNSLKKGRMDWKYNDERQIIDNIIPHIFALRAIICGVASNKESYEDCWGKIATNFWEDVASLK